jgi:hypothetical protein
MIAYRPTELEQRLDKSLNRIIGNPAMSISSRPQSEQALLLMVRAKAIWEATGNPKGDRSAPDIDERGCLVHSGSAPPPSKR